MSGRTCFLFGALLLVATACGPSRRDRGEETPPECDDGAVRECTCEGGATGTATCVDGAFGACGCADAVCGKGESRACTCEGGLAGTQSCRASRDAWNACECAGACVPSATEACRCGEATGTRTCNAAGTAWSACSCESSGCAATLLTASGELRTSRGNVNYAGQPVVASFSHRRAPGAGCIALARMDVRVGVGCLLSLEFGAADGASGGLLRARFEADGACPGFPADGRGVWTTRDGYAPYWFTGAALVADGSGESACVPDARITFASRPFVLARADGAEVSMNLAGLSLDGRIATGGDAALSCVAHEACAEGWNADATGWCTAGCAPPLHDGGDGGCVPAGECSFGFHDDGLGHCVAQGCAGGLHDGGDGRCVANGTCSEGFLLEPLTGLCIAGGGCDSNPPVANAGADVHVSPNANVLLDGSASRGPVAISEYVWTIRQKPVNSAAQVSGTGARPSLFVDVDGVYRLGLVVRDARGCESAEDAVTIRAGAVPASVSVRLTWAEAHGDLDVHYVGPGASPFEPSCGVGALQPCGGDVSWESKTPDWGLNGTTRPDQDRTNDPSLDMDDVGGFGPENVSHEAVFDGVYRVSALYYCDYGGTRPVNAKLTVFVDGTPREFQRQLLPQEVWEAAVITVSGGGTIVNVAAGTTPVTRDTIHGCG